MIFMIIIITINYHYYRHGFIIMIAITTIITIIAMIRND